jgi:hypothetical protein
LSRAEHLKKCRSCQAEIFWALTSDGKRMPVNAMPDPTGGFVLELVSYLPAGEHLEARVFDFHHNERKRYTSHFATCPDAGSWRKPRSTPPEKKP